MAVINLENVDVLNRVFNAAFMEGLEEADPENGLITTLAPSTAKTEDFSWLGKVPSVREWLGARVHRELSGHNYSITNRKWELTIDVDRDDLEDERGISHAPRFKDAGMEALNHRGRLAWETLVGGESAACFDGQNYFATTHPYVDSDATGTWSNLTAGASTPWYLADLRRPLKPIIVTDRVSPTLRSPTLNDESVHELDVFSWRTRARYAAGYGFPQLVHKSKAALDSTNFNAVYKAMMELRIGPESTDRPLNIRPTHLIVPPALRAEAHEIVKAVNDSGETNINAGIVKVFVTPYVME